MEKDKGMKSYELAVHQLALGNYTVFATWLKHARRINILNAIEYAMQEGLYKRHEIINRMRMALK